MTAPSAAAQTAGPRWALPFLVALLLLPAPPALAVDLLGRVVALGERESDPPEPQANTGITVIGAGSALTTDSGRFKLGLPYAAGAKVRIEVAAEGLVIYRPHRGEFRLPKPPDTGTPPDEVGIQLLPSGDPRLLDGYTISQEFERIAREALQQLRPDGHPDEIDFTGYLEELGRRLGFSLADVERAVADWQRRKQADPDTDPHELGLVALSEKRFEDARRLFRQSRLANEAALTEAEQRIAELKAQLDARRRLVIRDLRAEAEAASLGYDFAAALDLLRDTLGRIDRAAEPQFWAEVSVQAADARQELGIRTGGEDSARLLAQAVDAYGAALSVYTRDSLPQHWATTQNNLGNALEAQGNRTRGEDGTRLLAQAVDAYGAALTVFTRNTLPQDWAMTQSNLANALAQQGTRTGGEDGTRLLAEAVDAYRAALTVRTRESLPQRWATTQNNLANALTQQGIRTGGEDGTRLLAEAVDAYGAALTVFTRDTLPQDWARTQNNLAIALRNQGSRNGGEDGTRLLAQAVDAYRAALTVLTRDSLPQHWARTQNNLGNALQAQGNRTGGEHGARLLAQAVDAYRAALTVYTRDTLPQDWAMTQNNLANALQEQGSRNGGEDGTRLLAQAVDAYRAALSVYTRDSLPQDWAMTQNNLANALQEQGSRTGGEAGIRRLAEAVDAYRAALTVYTRDTLPQDWAMTQNNLANALQEQGSRTGGEAGIRLLAQAVDTYRAALTVYTRDSLPQDWARTQNNLGVALQEQGNRTGGEDGARLLAQAVDTYRAALTVFTLEETGWYWTQTQQNLLHALAALEDAAGMAAVLEDLLRAHPDNAELYNNAHALNHEVLFDFASAHRLTAAWVERHPDDLGARCNLAETLLTTGRTAEGRDALAALIDARRPAPERPGSGPPLDLSTEAALRLLEIAALTRLAADGGPDATAALAHRRTQLAELLAAQPDDFAIGWHFTGTLHYLGTDPGFAAHRDGLLALLKAAAEGRDALLELLR